ncbi:sensor histidine kinase [Olivibacter jilunii]|uniref:sensor histidine kinase n=1 Tax=Olivibacter jilunii TaxID=985016 RepID=UPI001031C621|nr:histidine kinase [Olivibacter jilunii]
MKLRRIEAIVATVITLVVMVIMFGKKTKNWEARTSLFLEKPFEEKGMTFNFFENHLLPTLLFVALFYIAFLTFNNFIIPRYINKAKYEMALFTSFLTLFILWFGFAYCEWMQHRYNRLTVWAYFGESGRVISSIVSIVLFISTYTLAKQGRLFLLQKKLNLSSTLLKESLIAFSVISSAYLFLLVFNGSMAFFWLIISIYLFIMYSIEMYGLLPFCSKAKYSLKQYLYVRLPLSFLIYAPFGFVVVSGLGFNTNAFFALWCCTCLISIPVIKHLYHLKLQHHTKLGNLENALGNSTANLSFLRSQINPHFLFNALNTLYGSALTEGAEMTATSIQKLGDIMRFMLHENILDNILLVREIEYLHNYIDLQKLRTDLSQNVIVDYNIQQVTKDLFIAPMLLIPFVENAFKHGISLKEPSWIKVNLSMQDDRLFFDVYNSVHLKQINDPEKNRSSIGIPNVRQRLLQLYPNKHELTIRQTDMEYFVHLTLTL